MPIHGRIRPRRTGLSSTRRERSRDTPACIAHPRSPSHHSCDCAVFPTSPRSPSARYTAPSSSFGSHQNSGELPVALELVRAAGALDRLQSSGAMAMLTACSGVNTAAWNAINVAATEVYKTEVKATAFGSVHARRRHKRGAREDFAGARALLMLCVVCLFVLFSPVLCRRGVVSVQFWACSARRR